MSAADWALFYSLVYKYKCMLYNLHMRLRERKTD